MAHYQVILDKDILQGLFVRDDGLARLVEDLSRTRYLMPRQPSNSGPSPTNVLKIGRGNVMDIEIKC